MALRIGQLYDALLLAHVPEDIAARLVLEEIAAYDRDMSTIRIELTAIRGEMAWVKWMLGTNLVVTVGILGRLLFVR